jgi:exonuclease VII small subunit
MALVGQCSQSLTALKNRVMILRERNGALVEEPMDDGDECCDDLEPVR